MNTLQRPSGLISARFAEMAPLGFEAGDANLYRYVGNNATNLIDPSGLDAIRTPDQAFLEHKDKMKDTLVKFENGAQGVVKVYKQIQIEDATGKKDSDWIQFEFKLTKAAEKFDMAKLHWVQIFRVYRGTGQMEDDRTFKSVYPTEGEVWRQFGTRLKYLYVDGRKGAYDLTGEKARSKDELSIFDKPDAISPDGGGVTGVFDTFLVYDGKPYYHVHWEAQQGGKTPKYSDTLLYGEAIPGKISDTIKKDKELVTFLKDDELLWAYRERVDKYNVKKDTAIKAPNLIDAKYR